MDVFYALAEPRRRRIIELLAKKQRLSAGDIWKSFDISKQAISQHLKILLGANLIFVERSAQQRIYSLNPDSVLELEEWVEKTRHVWEARVDRLGSVLEEEKRKKLKR
jgi:DNA-binding transcriptional ArsR family regulator